jgi:hypothetical protein
MWQRALSGSGGGGSDAVCILTVDTTTAKDLNTDYITFSNGTATFVKACKGFIFTARQGTVGGTASYTQIKAPENYGVGLYSFDAKVGETISYTASAGVYGWGMVGA